MSTYHTPVLLREVLDALAPAPGMVVVDATLGGGGHSQAIAARIAPDGILVGIDQDDDALAEAGRTLQNVGSAEVRLRKANFAEIGAVLQAEQLPHVHGVLMDLGVSSHQLDTARRGFAFRYNGPLDMRMNASVENGGETAAQMLNRLPEIEIARILFEFGEESRSRRIASEIVRKRSYKPLETTEDLVDAVRSAMPSGTRAGDIHPATKTFQAVRIAVNRELSVLETALRAAADALAPGGRLVVISYHSGEDRIVKNVLNELSGKQINSDWGLQAEAARPLLSLVTKKPVAPDAEEVRANPRARSAKLRVAERLLVEGRAEDEGGAA